MKTLSCCTTIAALLFSTTVLAADSETKWISLFDGSSLDGWTFDLQKDGAAASDVWSIKEGGVLYCKGNPRGVLRTEKPFGDYELELEWRWPATAGNSGVLVHCGEPRTLGIWPRSLELQLASNNAGDFWDIGTDCDVPNEDARRRGRNINRLAEELEKPLGEWNRMKIRCEGNQVTVWVNDKMANQCQNLVNKDTGQPLTSGPICLQSEGREIEYRNVRLKPL